MTLLVHLASALVPPAAAAPSPLDGAWRFDVVVTTRAQVPLLGETVVETHKVMLAHVDTRPDGRIEQSHTACGMYARSNKRIAQTWFPPDFISALTDQRYPVELRPEGEGWHLRCEVEPVRLGWDPTASGGVMPRTAGAPGVVDGDHDGHPGVTVHVRAPLFGEVEVYVVQSSETWLDGRMEGRDLVTGQAGLSLLQQKTSAPATGCS